MFKKVEKNLKHETNFITKYKDFLFEYIIKIKVSRLLSKYKHGKNMNTENSNTNEPRKSALNLLQILNLRRSSKHVALQNLSIYYTWKIIGQQQTTLNLK